MLVKDQKDQDTSNQNPGPSSDPIQQHYDNAFNDIASNYGDTTEHPKGEREVNAVADAENNAESSINPENKSQESTTPEQSFYNNVDDSGSTVGGIKNAYIKASPLKKGLGGGGIVGIIILIYAFFSFLPIFQLVHLAESLDLAFNAQNRRITSRRASLHYKLAFNGEYFEKKGLAGRISKGYATLDPKALLKDLQNKGSLGGTDLKLDSQGRVTVNGEVLDGKVKAQRLKVGEILDDAYPQDTWMKRQARKRTAYKAMGIKRVFFENTKKNVANWELEMIKRLRQRLGGDTAVRVSGNNGDSQAEAEANELDKSLAESPENVPKPIDDINIGEATAGTDPDIKPSAALGVIGKGTSLTGAADTLCDAKYYLKGIELAAIVARHAALLAHTGSLLVAAHQLKTGEGVTGPQVSGLMSILNRKPGLGASGSYQLLSGNKDATVKYGDELALNFKNAKGFGGSLSALNTAVDGGLNKIETYAKVDPDSYCKVSRNWFYQGGSLVLGGAVTVAGVVGGAATGGTTTAAAVGRVAAQVALAISIEGLKVAARPYLIRAMAGPEAVIHYGQEQKGDFMGDALIGGALATASGDRYQNGMNQSLDSAQVAEIENTIALEKNEKLKNESVFTKYIAIGNVDSQLSKQLAIMPSTPQAAAQSASQNIASLPSRFISALGLFTPQGKAHAADSVAGNPYITQNPLGVTMYGTTDAKIEEINDKYDIIENENWILDPANGGLEEYTKWANECYPADSPTMLTGMPLDEDQEDLIAKKCTMNGVEKYERYATYRLDRGIQQGILFMSGQSDCMDPDNEDPDCPFVDENTAANGANDVSVDPQTIEFREYNLTKLLEKYTDKADFVGTLDAGKTLKNSDSCDSSWNGETINSIKTPIEWDKSSHFCWPSSIKGKDWTPQGISGSSSTSDYPAVNGRNIILTSWYSLADETGYEQSRRSDENNSADAEVNKLVAVDIDSQKYEEIELVAPCSDDTAKLCALGIHAGGVGWLGQKVIVAYGFGFYSFDLNNLRKDGDKYILPTSGKWKGSALGLDEKNILISSSMSVDKGAKQIISANWHASEPLRIYRWNLNGSGTDFASVISNTSVNHEYSTAVGVQGVASDNGITFANSSNADGEDGGIGGALYYWPSFQTGNATGRRMPSGVVEGIYIDNQRDKIWSLTEHGIQYVFSFPLSSTVGSINTPTDDKVPAVTVNPKISTTSSGVSFVDGEYAWPVDIPYKYAGANNELEANVDWNCNSEASGCHHNGEPAFDLFDNRARNDPAQDGLTVGKAVFAVTSGKMEQSHIYKDIQGCYSFHIIGDDGYDYYYTHIKNPIISGSGQVKTVKVGDKVAEIGERKCTDPVNVSLPHLHIERAKKGLTVTGTNPESYRDPVLEDIIVELHNRLPK